MIKVVIAGFKEKSLALWTCAYNVKPLQKASHLVSLKLICVLVKRTQKTFLYHECYIRALWTCAYGRNPLCRHHRPTNTLLAINAISLPSPAQTIGYINRNFPYLQSWVKGWVKGSGYMKTLKMPRGFRVFFSSLLHSRSLHLFSTTYSEKDVVLDIRHIFL